MIKIKLYKTLILITTLAIISLIVFTQIELIRPIKIGMIYSLSESQSGIEQSMMDAALLAVDEINEQGGLLGRSIQPIIRETQTKNRNHSDIAETLIKQEKVEAIFSCWSLACPKTVIKTLEDQNHLLYFLAQHKGMESSKNTIYVGETPNQQVISALEWVFNVIGNRIYLVGSDYVYPHITNEIVKDQVQLWRGEIAGESYFPLGHTDFDGLIVDIIKAKPSVIFNTIKGGSNRHFFQSMRRYGITPQDIPTFSFSLSESELAQYNQITMQGDYLVWNYLHGLDNPINEQFIQRFKNKYGEDRVIGSPMVSAYLSIYLWAKAVQRTQSSNVAKVLHNASDISLRGPSGMIYIESKTQHAWKTIHIGRINQHNQLESIWHSDIPIAPESFPKTRTKLEWLHYIASIENTLSKGNR